MNARSLSIAIACYPTYGGSGVIATEAGLELARRGHQVHFFSYDTPRRLTSFRENIFFHQVEAPSYPLFPEPHYVLALASKISQVAKLYPLDIVHAHYALPHAVSAFLARESLGHDAFKIVVTLHGTDITVVGNDPGYLPMTKFSITLGDAVTAVSEYLKKETYREIGIPESYPIHVIPNFVDLEVFRACRNISARIRSALCRNFRDPNKLIITHVSNFRAVKQVHLIVQAFAAIRSSVPCALLMVGDGPERPRAEELSRELGLDCSVCFLGKQDSVEEILSASDLFVLASSTESFGLSALEAMASGIPVVAPRVGGIPEVVQDGVTGLMVKPNDSQALAEGMRIVLSDASKRAAMGEAGRKVAEENFNVRNVVTQYEDLYRGLVKH